MHSSSLLHQRHPASFGLPRARGPSCCAPKIGLCGRWPTMVRDNNGLASIHVWTILSHTHRHATHMLLQTHPFACRWHVQYIQQEIWQP